MPIKKNSVKSETDLPATLPGRKLPVWKRKSVPSTPYMSSSKCYPEPKRALPDPLTNYDNTPKPTRFEWPEDELESTFNLIDNSFNNISYSTKTLLTQDDELKAGTSFDDLKHLPGTNKKSKDYTNETIDMEEVKNYVKEQKIRSDLVDYEDEDDPDASFADSFDEEPKGEVGFKRKSEKLFPVIETKKVRFSINEKENKEIKVSLHPFCNIVSHGIC